MNSLQVRLVLCELYPFYNRPLPREPRRKLYFGNTKWRYSFRLPPRSYNLARLRQQFVNMSSQTDGCYVASLDLMDKYTGIRHGLLFEGLSKYTGSTSMKPSSPWLNRLFLLHLDSFPQTFLSFLQLPSRTQLLWKKGTAHGHLDQGICPGFRNSPTISARDERCPYKTWTAIRTIMATLL